MVPSTYAHAITACVLAGLILLTLSFRAFALHHIDGALPCLLLQISILKLSCDADEKDPSVPRVAPPTPPTPQENVTPGGVTACPDTATEVETNLVSAPAAALPIPASAEADSTPGDSHVDSDSCAEKVAELSLEANPAGLQLAKEVKEEEEDLSLLKALSMKELQAYGPQSESGYMSSDLCEDVDDLNISDGGSDASEGAVSDTCSEEQEDFQAVRLVADEEAASQATELQDDWVLAEADGPEWI